MYNDPNKQLGFYSQNTFNGQSYPAQNYPGQFNYSPPPPAPSQKKKGFWKWYKQQRKGAQALLGCGTIFVVLMLCTCSIASIGAAFPAKQTSIANQSVTPLTHQQIPTAKPATLVHKPTPTSQPTATPTPVPTLAPIPTPRPILPTPVPVKPTQAPVPPVQPAPPAPTQAPAPTGVFGNPWGYNFVQGNYIDSPPSNFCDYFNCIKSFWQSTNGYVDECNDQTFSHSGGVSGACSKHGGEMRPLYSH